MSDYRFNLVLIQYRKRRICPQYWRLQRVFRIAISIRPNTCILWKSFVKYNNNIINIDPIEQEREAKIEGRGKAESLPWLEENKLTFSHHMFHSNRLAIDFESSDLQKIDANLRSAVLEAARDSGMTKMNVVGGRVRSGRRPWFNSDCREAKELANNQLRQQIKKHHNPADFALCKDLKKKYRNLIDEKNRAYANQLTQQLSQVENRREL